MTDYEILKVVLGSYNQGEVRIFGETAGTQCACIALYSIFWSKFRRISIWNTNDLDKILVEGDYLYKNLRTRNHLNVDEMPRMVEVNNFIINAQFENLKDCFFTVTKGEPFLRNHFGDDQNNEFAVLLIISQVTVAIFKRRNSETFFLFDSHSRDCHGLAVPDGKSCFLHFKNLFQVEKYMQAFYLELRGKDSDYFQLQFISFQDLSANVVEFLRTNFRNFSARQNYRKHKLNYTESHKKVLKPKKSITEILKTILQINLTKE